MFFIGKPYISVKDSIPIVDTVAYCADNINLRHTSSDKFNKVWTLTLYSCELSRLALFVTNPPLIQSCKKQVLQSLQNYFFFFAKYVQFSAKRLSLNVQIENNFKIQSSLPVIANYVTLP